MSTWIYTRDRLPENEDMVLICCVLASGRKSVKLGYFYKKTNDWVTTGSNRNVVAWCPLPDTSEVEDYGNES